GVHPALRPLPPAVRSRLIAGGLLTFLALDARQDFAIWQHKRYVHPPALAAGDGPIGKYRSWAARFYQTPPPPAVPTPV
ncbi:MAG: (2Fe-2S)-binding protein, partial [Candidatus Binatia bacterium]